MNDEKQIVVAQSTVVPRPDGNISCTATLPEQMKASQDSLIQWAHRKCAELIADVKELTEAMAHAKRCKWNWKPLANQLRKAEKRLTFYDKTRLALEQGFCIVPNFPVQMFAIRTDKDAPNAYAWSLYQPSLPQEAKELPAGEGEYQNPFPIVHQNYDVEKNERSEKLWHTNNWDDFEFPLVMAKANIMEATTNTMALKIFDEIGVFPHSRTVQGIVKGVKGDPVICGIIRRKEGYDIKCITFMIAWHLDTRDL